MGFKLNSVSIKQTTCQKYKSLIVSLLTLKVTEITIISGMCFIINTRDVVNFITFKPRPTIDHETESNTLPEL